MENFQVLNSLKNIPECIMQSSLTVHMKILDQKMALNSYIEDFGPENGVKLLHWRFWTRKWR